MSARVTYNFLIWLIVAAGGFFLFACEEEAPPAADVKKPGIKPGMSSIEARKQIEIKQGSGLIEKSSKKEYSKRIGISQLRETDFIKTPRRRDPFEPFIEVLATQEDARKLVQRNVKLKEYDISDLKLIGIITNIGDPRAMVVVPDGTGFVLKRGDYVGRADFIQQLGSRGEQIQVNWRVTRIHGSGKEEERGVYLVRDDPTTTKGVDVTRFLSLHPSQ
jgi:Tfp pilus assembly protein PilP